jgi:hypothetical protein
MSEKEDKNYLISLQDFLKEVTATKEASRKFLIDVGIVNKKGKRTKEYKHLCIQ